MSRTMNTDTYEALRQVELGEDQAKVLATAIPDIEPLRVELRGEMDKLRRDMDVRFEQVNTRFAEMDARFHMQRNLTIIATLVLIGTVIAAAKDFWGLLG